MSELEPYDPHAPFDAPEPPPPLGCAFALSVIAVVASWWWLPVSLLLKLIAFQPTARVDFIVVPAFFVAAAVWAVAAIACLARHLRGERSRPLRTSMVLVAVAALPIVILILAAVFAPARPPSKSLPPIF